MTTIRFRRVAAVAVFVVLAVASTALVPACSTVKGAGQDLQDASDGVRDAFE